MSFAKDKCQGTGIVDKFVFIFKTGTNGYDGRCGQKSANQKGKCQIPR